MSWNFFILPMILYFLLLLFIRMRWPVSGKRKSEDPKLPLSLIIACRNEARHLPRLLAALEAQRFPPELFEVIFADDHSDDGGPLLLRNYRGPLSLRLLSSSGEGKKKALAEGIAAARYAHCLFTDADCLPGPAFLSAVSEAFSRGHDWVGGQVAVNDTNTFIARFESYDQAALMAITAAGYTLGKPALASGAFMALPRQLLAAVSLNAGKRDAGSDIEILESVRENLQSPSFITDPDALVRTDAHNSLRSFLGQRKRWARTGLRIRHPFILALITAGGLSQLFQLLFFVSLPFSALPPGIPLFLIAVKAGLEALVIYAPLKNAGSAKNFLLIFPFVALLYPLYLFSAAFLGIFTGYNWKGRSLS